MGPVSSYTTRGKIVSERQYMDRALMMRQLGVMPAAASLLDAAD